MSLELQETDLCFERTQSGAGHARAIDLTLSAEEIELLKKIRSLSDREKSDCLRLAVQYLPMWVRQIIFAGRTDQKITISDVWLFFCDLCDFTTISESLMELDDDGDTLASVMNLFWGALQEVFIKYGFQIVFPEGDAQLVFGRNLEAAGIKSFISDLNQAIEKLRQNKDIKRVTELVRAKKPDFQLAIKMGFHHEDQAEVLVCGDDLRKQAVFASAGLHVPIKLCSREVGFSEAAKESLLESDQAGRTPNPPATFWPLGVEPDYQNPDTDLAEVLKFLPPDSFERLVRKVQKNGENGFSEPVFDERNLYSGRYKRLVEGVDEQVHASCVVAEIFVDGISDLFHLNRLYRDLCGVFRRYGAVDQPMTPLGMNSGKKFAVIVNGVNQEMRALMIAEEALRAAEAHNCKARVGIAAGPMCMFDVGGRSYKEYSYFGNAFNIAARIAAQVPQGVIEVDHSLIDRLPGVRWGRSENKRFKGLSADREVHAFSDNVDYILRADLLASDLQFAGRERELEQLNEMLARDKAVCVYGELGIGKSSLLRRFLQNCPATAGKTINVIRQNFYQGDQFKEVIGLFDQLLGLKGTVSTSERLSKIDWMDGILPASRAVLRRFFAEDFSQTVDFQSEIFGQFLADSFIDLMQNLRGKEADGGYIVVVEDAEFLSSGSARFFGDFVQKTKAKDNFWFIFSKSMSENRQVWENAVQPFNLERIETRDSVKLSEFLLSQHFGVGWQFDERIYAYIENVCQGNPLLIEAVIQRLLESGSLLEHPTVFNYVSLDEDFLRGRQNLKVGVIDYLLDPYQRELTVYEQQYLNRCAFLERDIAPALVGRVFGGVPLDSLKAHEILTKFCAKRIMAYDLGAEAYQFTSPLLSDKLQVNNFSTRARVENHAWVGASFLEDNNYCEAYHHFLKAFNIVHHSLEEFSDYLEGLFLSAWFFATETRTRFDTSEIVGALELVSQIAASRPDLAAKIPARLLYRNLAKNYSLLARFDESLEYYGKVTAISSSEEIALASEICHDYKKRWAPGDKERIMKLCGQQLDKLEKRPDWHKDPGLRASSFYFRDAVIMAGFYADEWKRKIDGQKRSSNVQEFISRELEVYQDMTNEPDLSESPFLEEYLRVCNNLQILYGYFGDAENAKRYVLQGHNLCEQIMGGKNLQSADQCELIAGNLLGLMVIHLSPKCRDERKVIEYGDLATRFSKPVSPRLFAECAIARGEIYSLDDESNLPDRPVIEQKLFLNLEAYIAIERSYNNSHAIWALANIIQCKDVLLKHFGAGSREDILKYIEYIFARIENYKATLAREYFGQTEQPWLADAQKMFMADFAVLMPYLELWRSRYVVS